MRAAVMYRDAVDRALWRRFIAAKLRPVLDCLNEERPDFTRSEPELHLGGVSGN